MLPNLCQKGILSYTHTPVYETIFGKITSAPCHRIHLRLLFFTK